jgi:ketosteroid isomerase-like protein
MIMNSNWILGVFITLVLGSAPSLQAQTGSDSEKAVLMLEYQWLQSDKTNDPDLAAPMLADKYVSTGSDGKLADKAETVAQAKGRKYSSAEYEDIKTMAFGDTVIVTGGYKGKGTEAGKPFAEHFRWTDTWVKMPGGKWQCVATQYTEIKN